MIHAPFTDDQVASLNAYQTAGYVHPFTGAAGGDLFATRDGWIEKPGGSVVQTWAHEFMGDWSWRQGVLVNRPIVDRIEACAVCGLPIRLRSVTSPHPEAPEMAQMPHDAWFGLLVEEGEETAVVLVCSERCVQRLLRQ